MACCCSLLSRPFVITSARRRSFDSNRLCSAKIPCCLDVPQPGSTSCKRPITTAIGHRHYSAFSHAVMSMAAPAYSSDWLIVATMSVLRRQQSQSLGRSQRVIEGILSAMLLPRFFGLGLAVLSYGVRETAVRAVMDLCRARQGLFVLSHGA
ncbi:hypothetical protein BC834DRAFT_171279 [Gloeopeniophorella convolvens]|nr:hypothetical protein BC834DRAFT_171279 [Gloeopeniophorella convolvens]